MNRGKRDGFYVKQIMEMVNRHVRNERIEMGRIDLMQNFSFFEVPEKQANTVLRALSHAHVNGQHVIVELAGDAPMTEQKSKDRKPKNHDEKEGFGNSFAQYEKKNRAERRREEQLRGTEKAAGKQKPSREERGYTGKRGPMKKDDWKQFFQQDERPLCGAEPDFSEEGWARRKPKRK